MSDPLDELVREARKELGTPEVQRVDWDVVDSALFDRIRKERRAERGSLSASLRGWRFVAVAMAGAAIVALALGKERGQIRVPQTNGSQDRGATNASQDRGATSASQDQIATNAGQDESAGTIVKADGEGLVLVDGAPVLRGAILRLGDVVEPRGANVTVERPGKLAMILERGSRVRVTQVVGMLVVALEQGALEARVVPVASGQAFAVDIQDSRVAVHGTHFRVARTGGRVAVDLSEGVVSIGPTLQVGSMQAPLVAAPAHAEFGATDVAGTLTVTHEPSAVRAPAAIGSAAATTAIATIPSQRARTETVPPRSALLEAGADRLATAGQSAPPIPEPRSNADVEIELANAVRACMVERPHAENVTVIVSTTLLLDLNADGTVRGARFDPPVALDVNECATKSIYRTHFVRGGTATATIPIDFTN